MTLNQYLANLKAGHDAAGDFMSVPLGWAKVPLKLD